MNVSIRLIDVCLPCYLQDHHGRDGEFLLCVPVDGATKYQDVLEALIGEFQGYQLENAPNDDEFLLALVEEFSTVKDMSLPFDASLDVCEDDDEEFCGAYFLLQWDADNV